MALSPSAVMEIRDSAIFESSSALVAATPLAELESWLADMQLVVVGIDSLRVPLAISDLMELIF